MENLEFTIELNAPKEKVWETLWGKDTYSQWTEAFGSGSKAITDWKKGSKVLFLDGNGLGMVGAIAENIPNRYMSIEMLGEVKDGVEDTTSDRVKEWQGARENYTLETVNGKTRLDIQLTGISDPQFVGMMKTMWPKALDLLKKLVEPK